jgi:hypothetical protein
MQAGAQGMRVLVRELPQVRSPGTSARRGRAPGSSRMWTTWRIAQWTRSRRWWSPAHSSASVGGRRMAVGLDPHQAHEVW